MVLERGGGIEPPLQPFTLGRNHSSPLRSGLAKHSSMSTAAYKLNRRLSMVCGRAVKSTLVAKVCESHNNSPSRSTMNRTGLFILSGQLAHRLPVLSLCSSCFRFIRFTAFSMFRRPMLTALRRSHFCPALFGANSKVVVPWTILIAYLLIIIWFYI